MFSFDPLRLPVRQSRKRRNGAVDVCAFEKENATSDLEPRATSDFPTPLLIHLLFILLMGGKIDNGELERMNLEASRCLLDMKLKNEEQERIIRDLRHRNEHLQKALIEGGESEEAEETLIEGGEKSTCTTKPMFHEVHSDFTDPNIFWNEYIAGELQGNSPPHHL